MSGYKTICPQCGGDNLYVTDHNGMQYCFNCAFFKKDVDIVTAPQMRGPIAKIRNEYESLTRYWHGNVGYVRKYLHSRGITDESIERFKLGYAPKGKHPLYNKDNGIYLQFEDTITFPYIYKGTVYDIRARVMDDRLPKYTSPHGSRFYRGADYPFNMDDAVYPHLLTEGEIKAIIATQFGYRCVGFPGITSQYSKYVPSKYHIVLDNQKNHRQELNRATIRWATYGLDPYVITLPLGEHDKIGLDDYLLMYGKEKFELLYPGVPFHEWRNLCIVT